MRQHIADQIKTYKRYFSSHRATLCEQEPVKVLVWKGSGPEVSYQIGLPLRLLIVTGEVGDAIYTWANQVDFSGAVRIGLDTFAHLCTAPPLASGLTQWYPEAVVAALKEHEAELISEYGEAPLPLVEHMDYLIEAAQDAQDWVDALNALNEMDVAGEVLGSAWGVVWPGIGYDHSPGIVAHWIGLQMAWKQLQGLES